MRLSTLLLCLIAATACQNKNHPPPVRITAPGMVEVQLGSSVAFAVTAIDPSGKAVPITGARPLPLPKHATLDAVSGEFRFTPDAEQVGDQEITFLAQADRVAYEKTTILRVTARDARFATELNGVALESDGASPVVGAVVRIPGTTLETRTDKNGAFQLKGVPPTSAVVEIDGMALSPAIAYVAEDINLVLGHPLYEHQANNIERPIYLPVLGPPAGTVDPSGVSRLSNPQARIEVTVAKNSAMANGQAFRGAMFIPEVRRDRTPAALPETLQPAQIIAIQPAGLTFDPPASISFPNLDGLATGTLVNIWSIDPATGTFIVAGKGTVQGDRIVSNGGVIRNSSWHFPQPRGPGAKSSDDDSAGNDNPFGCSITGQSAVSIKTGGLKETHRLVSYRSMNVERVLELVYNSHAACPTAIANLDGQIEEFTTMPKAISVRAGAGGVSMPGESFVTASSEASRFSAVFDTALFPTGIYDLKTYLTSHYSDSSVASISTSRLLVNNERDSAFGSGWSLSGLHRLHVQTDNRVVITDGEGGIAAFQQGSAFEFPDFSNLGAVQLNGSTAQLSNPVAIDGRPALRLTQSVGGPTAGSAFASTPIPLVTANGPTSFHTRFSFSLSKPGGEGDPDGPGADGICFVIAPQSTALGQVGVGIGYGGIANSVAVEFDTYANPGIDPVIGTATDGNHIGVDASGELRSIVTKHINRRMNDGDTWFAWIDYDGPSKQLEVRLALSDLKPSAPSLTTVIDVAEQLGQASAFFGFTAGSWNAFNNQDILSWSLSYDLGASAETWAASPGDFSVLSKDSSAKTWTRRMTDGTRLTFNERGLHVSTKDRNDQALTYSYDDKGRLVAMTDPVGKVTEFNYGSSGLLSMVTVPGAGPTMFEHSGKDLVKIEDPDGTKRKFSYDGLGRMTQQFDKRDFSTTYTYGVGPSVATATRQGMTNQASPRRFRASHVAGVVPEGTSSLTSPAPRVPVDEATTRYTNELGHVTTLKTDRLGHGTYLADTLPTPRVTKTQRNDNGLPIRTTQANGRVDTATFNAHGQMLTQVQAVGLPIERTSHFTYHQDYWSLPVTYTDPANAVTVYSYDTKGNLTSVRRAVDGVPIERTSSFASTGLQLTATDEEGRTSTFTYDSAGNLETITDPLGHVQKLARDSRGNVLSVSDAFGTTSVRTRTFSYDALNRVITVSDGASGVTTNTYDNAGNLTHLRLPTGETVVREYDSMDRLIRITDPVRGVTELTYDDAGELREQKDALLRKTALEYDEAGQLLRKVDAAGGIETYGYDKMGRLTSFKDARGNVTQFGFDELGRRTSMTSPELRVRSWSYDSRDNMVGEFQPGIPPTAHGYDSLSRRRRTIVPSIVSSGVVVPLNIINFTYDKTDKLRTVSDADTTLEYTYDAAGRLAEQRTLAGGIQPATTLTSSYSEANDRIGLTDSMGGTQRFGFDGAGRMTVAAPTPSASVGLSYDFAGRLRSITYPNGIVSARGYEAGTGRLASIVDQKGGQSPVLSLVYGHNAVGFVGSIQDGAHTWNYGYDNLDRLRTATAPNGTESYGYDPVGNRTVSHLSNVHEVNRDNQLTSDQQFTYLYDERGNLTTQTARSGGEVTQYIWDAQNQLVEVRRGTPPATPAPVASYRYDGFGRRVEKNVAGAPGIVRRYVYDGDNINLEFSGSNVFQARYLHGDQVDQHLAMERGGQLYYYHTDHLGSVRRVTDGAGSLVSSYNYDSYGQTIPVTWQPQEGVENPFWFTGREEGREQQAYYYRARWYGPRTGRFWSEDPLLQDGRDGNLYRYAMGAPSMFSDPSGMDAETKTIATIIKLACRGFWPCKVAIDVVTPNTNVEDESRDSDGDGIPDYRDRDEQPERAGEPKQCVDKSR